MPSHFQCAKVVSRLKSIGCTAAPHCYCFTLIVSKVTILMFSLFIRIQGSLLRWKGLKNTKYTVKHIRISIQINKLQQELMNRDELIDVFALNKNTDLLVVSNKTKSFAAEDVKNRKYLTFFFFLTGFK